MSDKPLSLREQLVELNDSQWQLLERELLAVLPKRPMINPFQRMEGSFTNGVKIGQQKALDQATDSIRKALSK